MQTDERGLVYWEPSHMVEIFLSEPDDFLKVRETLTRIGVASRREKKIYQSCHILHKQGRYFIVHFKPLTGRLFCSRFVLCQMATLHFQPLKWPLSPRFVLLPRILKCESSL